MGKDKSSKDGHNNFPDIDSIEGSTYKPSEQMDNETYKQSEDFVTLVFKQNRTKELHVGKVVYRFEGPGSKVDVPKSVIAHPDFEGQRKYFTIKEVN